MLGNLPSHLQDKIQFNNTKGIILSTLIPSYFRDLPLQNLLQQKEYLHLIRKIKSLNTYSQYAPKMILKHIIIHDNLRFYLQIKKYFQSVFKNETHLLNLIATTIKENDVAFLPKKILNHLFQETDFFLNLPYPKIVLWFSNALYLNEYQIAYQFVILYPQHKNNLFQHIFKGLLKNLNGIQLWESLNPKSTSQTKWDSIDSETHFKHFWESNFPGGIGLYLIKSKLINSWGLYHLYEFYPTNFDYYRRYHWMIKNTQQRKAISKKLETLAYLLQHDRSFILDETGTLKMNSTRNSWVPTSSNPIYKFENDMRELALYYSFLAEYIYRNITTLNPEKKPLPQSMILTSFKTMIGELTLAIQPYLERTRKDRWWEWRDKEESAKYTQLKDKLKEIEKIRTSYKKLLQN